jgi:ubiquitin-protein ligase
VTDKGEICPEMLETTDKWAPTKKLVGVIEKIKSLMLVPNLDTPMNQDAANNYKNGTWFQKAKAETLQYAK